MGRRNPLASYLWKSYMNILRNWSARLEFRAGNVFHARNQQHLRGSFLGRAPLSVVDTYVCIIDDFWDFSNLSGKHVQPNR